MTIFDTGKNLHKFKTPEIATVGLSENDIAYIRWWESLMRHSLCGVPIHESSEKP